MQHQLSLEKPLFLFDRSSRDLHYVVTNIIFASERSLLVCVKIIANENVKNNEHFSKEEIVKSEGKTFEVLIDEKLIAHSDELDRHVMGHFAKQRFDNYIYNAPGNVYDENLKEENFEPANIHNLHQEDIKKWFKRINERIQNS